MQTAAPTRRPGTQRRPRSSLAEYAAEQTLVDLERADARERTAAARFRSVPCRTKSLSCARTTCVLLLLPPDRALRISAPTCDTTRRSTPAIQSMSRLRGSPSSGRGASAKPDEHHGRHFQNRFQMAAFSPAATALSHSKTSVCGHVLDGSDGTRTRDLRRDRCDQTVSASFVYPPNALVHAVFGRFRRHAFFAWLHPVVSIAFPGRPPVGRTGGRRRRRSTSSLPCAGHCNRSQPAATVFACLSRSWGQPICDGLPPVATTGLHKGFIVRCPI